MIDISFHKANSIDDTLDLLSSTGAKLIAGGTDILPRMQKGTLIVKSLVDIHQLLDLCFIRETDDRVEIGAATTHSVIINSSILQQYAPILIDAISTIGCPQTRARGTLGGNLINASPAADSAPPLLALDADLVIRSKYGEKVVPLSKFFVGPGKTVLEPGELLTTIRIKKIPARSGAAFQKLGKRKGMAISVASVAAYVELDTNNRIKDIRIAYGSLAPTPLRAYNLENCLKGYAGETLVVIENLEKCLQDISPISDLRATSEYRKKTALVLTRRVLEIALSNARK